MKILAYKIQMIVLLAIICVEYGSSQTYRSDSLNVIIHSRTYFEVSIYDDLKIPIEYYCKSKKKLPCYSKLVSKYRSTFGNCYFEIFKIDSSGSYRNITEFIMGATHPPKEFENWSDVLKYDLDKTDLLFNQRRILFFNPLDFISGLQPGKYSLTFYLRAANNFGYDELGNVTANSICYLESTIMNFEVIREVRKK